MNRERIVVSKPNGVMINVSNEMLFIVLNAILTRFVVYSEIIQFFGRWIKLQLGK